MRPILLASAAAAALAMTAPASAQMSCVSGGQFVPCPPGTPMPGMAAQPGGLVGGLVGGVVGGAGQVVGGVARGAGQVVGGVVGGATGQPAAEDDEVAPRRRMTRREMRKQRRSRGT